MAMATDKDEFQDALSAAVGKRLVGVEQVDPRPADAPGMRYVSAEQIAAEADRIFYVYEHRHIDGTWRATPEAAIREFEAEWERLVPSGVRKIFWRVKPEVEVHRDYVSGQKMYGCYARLSFKSDEASE